MAIGHTLLAAATLAATANCTIQWAPCNETEFNTTTIPYECGNLEVPLDYTDPDSQRVLSLELIKAPAALESKGSILFNFGGPGEAGRQDLTYLASSLLPLTGGQYDLIAFDPRGTGNTIPMKCTDNLLEGYIMLGEQQLGNSSDVALGRLWARGAIDANLCYEHANDTGRFVSTSFVARDLMSVVDALGEDGMLRYWGFSYGTTLGATVTAMFPDRIDKVILDGVQNPHEYYHAQADFEEWTDSDKEFSSIFSTCIEDGPTLCALAARNKTAQELEDAVWNLLEVVKYRPIAIGTIMIDYTTLKGVIIRSLYSTALWPGTAAVLDALLFGPEEALAVLASSLAISPETEPAVEEALALTNAIAGIHCGDNLARVSTFEEFLPTVDQLYSTSRILGDAAMARYMLCAQWKIKPKETYEGDFVVQTKNPVLFIGNTYDGLTPLRSAKNVSSGYEGSVVLEVNGYGHASINLPSTCTLQTVAAYWVNGTLPKPGTVCEVDGSPYSGTTWADVFESAGIEAALRKRDDSPRNVVFDAMLRKRDSLQLRFPDLAAWK